MWLIIAALVLLVVAGALFWISRPRGKKSKIVLHAPVTLSDQRTPEPAGDPNRFRGVPEPEPDANGATTPAQALRATPRKAVSVPEPVVAEETELDDAPVAPSTSEDTVGVERFEAHSFRAVDSELQELKAQPLPVDPENLELISELEPEVEETTEPALPELAEPVAVEPEPAPVVVEPEPAPVAVEPEPAPVAVEPEPAPEELPYQQYPHTEVFPAVQHRGPRFSHFLPGADKRERRTWAHDHGFSFSREDVYLTDEWSRGAAASGAAPRDVVAGVIKAFGLDYEMYLVDLDNIPVIAIRRTGASDVVVDARRVGVLLDDASDDLLPVMQTSGFQILSNDFGAAERLIDERVIAALSALPESVTATWAESDWVLAQTTKNTGPEDWERIFEPLALLADAARVLPPRAVRKLELPTLTRPIPEGTAVEKQPEQQVVPVPRAEEPVDLPTRAQHTAKGVVEARPVGVDEVGAIADGPASLPESDGTRMVRRDANPTIF